jgi:hypothetical protein
MTASTAQPHWTETERPLPQNLEAERSVLGAILIDNAQFPVATEILKPSDFFHSAGATIFAAMGELREAAAPIDTVTLGDHLHKQNKLEAAGGVAYIDSLADGVPRVSNVTHYARIVKEKSQHRQLIYAANDVQQAALDAGEDPAVVLERATQSFAALRNGSVSWREVFHSFTDFETAAPLSFAIGGFLQNNGATMIGGLSGHGKTLVNLSIAKALLAGKGARLWDLFPVEENAVRVVYLIPESAIEPFKHRLRLFGLYDYLAPNDERLLVRTLSKGPTPCLSDPRILYGAKGAHVFLDTAVRFSAEGDENSAGDNQRGLAADIFALLASGARTVIGAHHAPKPFAKENVMRLENVLRGSGDIGAMLTTAWGIKQLDPAQNIIHIENLKPRDFQPVAPFQIIGRPFIDRQGDFQLFKRPGECGPLMDEQEPERAKGGAPSESREERARRIELVRDWLSEDATLTIEDLRSRFKEQGVTVSPSAVKNYRRQSL